eukprot:GILJ01003056.1.p1 GENE.GILJ01003056.1~~GILJ01003056.1.p1  ORF type:complete len:108 (-),score=11.11 GILJ01003056.1:158-481(-)
MERFRDWKREAFGSDYDIVVHYSKHYEHFLEEKLGATGEGLHQKITSVQNKIDVKTIKKLRYIATIRNKLIHDKNCTKLDDRKTFLQTCKEVNQLLDAQTKKGCTIQ